MCTYIKKHILLNVLIKAIGYIGMRAFGQLFIKLTFSFK